MLNIEKGENACITRTQRRNKIYLPEVHGPANKPAEF